MPRPAKERQAPSPFSDESDPIVSLARDKYAQIYGEIAADFISLPWGISQALVRRVDIILKSFAKFIPLDLSDFSGIVSSYIHENQEQFLNISDYKNSKYIDLNTISFIIKYKIDKYSTDLKELFRGSIEKLSHSEKLKIIDEFTRDNPGATVSPLIRELFPQLEERYAALPTASELGVDALPEVAPAIWKDERRAEETPPEFIMRVYAPWHGKGLTMADVRRLDEPLAQAMYYHFRKERPVPSGFTLERGEPGAKRKPADDPEQEVVRNYWRKKQAERRDAPGEGHEH